MSRLNLGLPFAHCSLPTCLVSAVVFPDAATAANPPRLPWCSSCRVTRYCSVAHQRSHLAAHRTACRLIKTTREALETEDAKLRDESVEVVGGDPNTPARPFDSIPGVFWLFKGTRDYMTARSNAVGALLNVRTGEAVEAALGHCLEMLRLCRGDNLSQRTLVPALYLRLGRDQEAWDFLKWWIRIGNAGFNFRDMSLPYCNLKGEDALESLEDGFKMGTNLAFLVAVTLIKIRLLLDVITLNAAVSTAREESRTLTAEGKMEVVKEHAMSDILLSRPDILAMDDYADLVKNLDGQVERMYALVKERNRHFWPAIQDPTEFAKEPSPAPYTFGSKEEALAAFKVSWYSWAETEDAVGLLRSMVNEDQAANEKGTV